MAKKRPHTGIANLAMPRINSRAKGEGDFPRGGPGRSKTPAGRSAAPYHASGAVSTQKRGGGGTRSSGPDGYERGVNPAPSGSRNPRGRLPNVSMRNTDMPRVGHQSATAPGALARPGSERGSATMDARSSVPTSIQEQCSAGNTVDRFSDLEANDSDSREDNAEIDSGFGTGRGTKGGRYRNLRY